jgi:membrane protein
MARPTSNSAVRSTVMTEATRRRGCRACYRALPFALGVMGIVGAVALAVGRPRADRRERKYAAKAEGRSAAGVGASAPTQIPARGWHEILARTYSEVNRDRVQAVAAGVTFYSLLALFPALTAFVSLYALFNDPSAIAGHLRGLDAFLPAGATDFLTDQVTRIGSGNGATLGLAFFFSLAMALWSANAGVKALFDALNVAYGEDEKRGFLRLNAVSLAFTAGILAFLLISLGAIAAIPIILDYVYLGSASEWLISVGRWPLLFIALVVGLGILYRFGPSRDDAQWKWVSPGALVAAVAWVIGSILFSWYVANFEDYNKAYGAVGAVIGLMTWMWLSATILLAGAELNAEAERQTDRDTTEGFPMPIGARGADAADRKP